MNSKTSSTKDVRHVQKEVNRKILITSKKKLWKYFGDNARDIVDLKTDAEVLTSCSSYPFRHKKSLHSAKRETNLFVNGKWCTLCYKFCLLKRFICIIVIDSFLLFRNFAWFIIELQSTQAIWLIHNVNSTESKLTSKKTIRRESASRLVRWSSRCLIVFPPNFMSYCRL